MRWNLDWNIGGIVFAELSAIKGAGGMGAVDWNLQGRGFQSDYHTEVMCHYAGEYQFSMMHGLQGEGTDYTPRIRSTMERAGGGGGGSSTATCGMPLNVYGRGGGGGGSLVRQRVVGCTGSICDRGALTIRDRAMVWREIHRYAAGRIRAWVTPG